MMTIQKIRVADCDRSTDDNGNYTSGAFEYCVCDNNDVSRSYETFETEAEAENYITDNE
jgi:hypothetical protein